MFKNFSPAANHVESIFQEAYTLQTKNKMSFIEKFFLNKLLGEKRSIASNQILVLKTDIYRDLNFHFKNMNAIVSSDMPVNTKQNLLTILRDNAFTNINDYPETLSSFTSYYDLSNEIYKEVRSYLISMIDTKYKRSLIKIK
jgi:hypothetical protein